jgi:hypothetical protein
MSAFFGVLFVALMLLSLMMTVIILCAAFLFWVLDQSDRHARGRNPFSIEEEISHSTGKLDWWDALWRVWL